MTDIDIKLFHIINNWAGRSEILDKVFIYGTRYSVVLFSLILLLYLFKKRRVFWTALFSALLARGVLTELVRYLYHRPRPFVDLKGVKLLIEKNGLEASFPSGHAAFMFAIALAVYLYSKKLGAILMVLAFLLSLARVYVGVHYPLDILGGIVLAGFSVFLVKKVVKQK